MLTCIGSAGIAELAVFHPVSLPNSHSPLRVILADEMPATGRHDCEATHEQRDTGEELHTAECRHFQRQGCSAVGQEVCVAVPRSGLRRWLQSTFARLPKTTVERVYASNQVTSLQVLQRIYKYGGQPVARDFLTKHYGADFEAAFGKKTGKAVLHSTAGSLIGIGEIVLLPLDVLKIKRQTNPEAFRGRGVLKIVADEGFGLYRGWGWTAARNAPGSFAVCLLPHLRGGKVRTNKTFVHSCLEDRHSPRSTYSNSRTTTRHLGSRTLSPRLPAQQRPWLCLRPWTLSRRVSRTRTSRTPRLASKF